MTHNLLNTLNEYFPELKKSEIPFITDNFSFFADRILTDLKSNPHLAISDLTSKEIVPSGKDRSIGTRKFCLCLTYNSHDNQRIFLQEYTQDSVDTESTESYCISFLDDLYMELSKKNSYVDLVNEKDSIYVFLDKKFSVA